MWTSWMLPALLLAPGEGRLVLRGVDAELSRIGAPMSVEAALTAEQTAAGREGRLWLRGADGTLTPAQLVPGEGPTRLAFRLPPGLRGDVALELVVGEPAANVGGQYDEATGRCELTDEAGKPVLRYNYRTIDPGAILDQIAEGNRIYCRSRSNYIHPLYGLDGEELTLDFPIDHPHHRGIYWGWPETMLGDQLGDLHALQRVFARPVGKLTLAAGPVYAELTAENLWLWDDAQPIVREQMTIRVWRTVAERRVIDLTLSMTALAEGVTIARRHTDAYGGLNCRMNAVEGQVITLHTDPPEAAPRRAWADLSGTFRGGRRPCGMTILQAPSNPEYPGDWVEFPNLNWFQPTFPTSGTRRPIPQDQPLTLRWRLIVHAGATPAEDDLAAWWQSVAAM